MLVKLLNNSVSIKILKILTKRPLSIPQIAKTLNIEISLVFAVLGELYHHNLVQQFESTESYENKKNLEEVDKNTNSFLNHQVPLSKPLLGIPLPDYLSFWEEIQNHPHKFNYDRFKKWVFSVPDSIASQISDCSPDEIKKRILEYKG